MQYNFSSLLLNILLSLIVLLGNDAVRRQLGCIFNQTNIGRSVTIFRASSFFKQVGIPTRQQADTFQKNVNFLITVMRTQNLTR